MKIIIIFFQVSRALLTHFFSTYIKKYDLKWIIAIKNLCVRSLIDVRKFTQINLRGSWMITWAKFFKKKRKIEISFDFEK